MRPEAESWWKQAGADLDAGRQLLEGTSYFGVSLFAQQATEKALKALFLDIRGQQPPRTHDLERIARDLQVPAFVMGDVALVTPAFDLARYPDPITGQAPVEVVTQSAATRHFEAAERILVWVKQQLAP